MKNLNLKLLFKKPFRKKLFDKNIFENIFWSWSNFNTHHDVAVALKDKNPYTISVLIESLKYEYWNKKEYVNKTKIQIDSKYKELLYEYFHEEFGREKENEVYGGWIDKYRPLHENERKYEFVDEYIIKQELEPRYRTQILKRFKNHDKLFKNGVRIDRDRIYNLPEPLNYIDWRTPFDNLFIWEENGKKQARRGGSGSSGSRETNSKFIFGLLELSKTTQVPSYLFIYSEENEFFFIKKFDDLCLPLIDIGSNYYLERRESEELMKHGLFIEWKDYRLIREIEIGCFSQL